MPINTAAQREAAKERLLELCPQETTVYVIVRWVAQSGMSRGLSPIVIHDGEPVEITGSVATLLGWPTDKRGGVKVNGTGMDMAFELVDSLSKALYGGKHSALCHRIL